MASSKVELTPTELLSTIQRSKLPTVLVEGSDDAVIFRKLEEYHADIDLSVLQCGGRSALLKIFERRSEVSNVKLAFIADQDAWVVHGIPPQFQSPEIVFTRGYSIENDLFVDGDVFQLIHHAQRPAFLTELAIITNWFALMLDRVVRGEAPIIDVSAIRLLEDGSYLPSVMPLAQGEVYPFQLEEDLVANYAILLRGKILLQLAIRHLEVSHHPLGLMDMIANMERGNLKRIIDAIANFFKPPLLSATAEN